MIDSADVVLLQFTRQDAILVRQIVLRTSGQAIARSVQIGHLIESVVVERYGAAAAIGIIGSGKIISYGIFMASITWGGVDPLNTTLNVISWGSLLVPFIPAEIVYQAEQAVLRCFPIAGGGIRGYEFFGPRQGPNGRWVRPIWMIQRELDAARAASTVPWYQADYITAALARIPPNVTTVGELLATVEGRAAALRIFTGFTLEALFLQGERVVRGAVVLVRIAGVATGIATRVATRVGGPAANLALAHDVLNGFGENVLGGGEDRRLLDNMRTPDQILYDWLFSSAYWQDASHPSGQFLLNVNDPLQHRHVANLRAELTSYLAGEPAANPTGNYGFWDNILEAAVLRVLELPLERAPVIRVEPDTPAVTPEELADIIERSDRFAAGFNPPPPSEIRIINGRVTVVYPDGLSVRVSQNLPAAASVMPPPVVEAVFGIELASNPIRTTRLSPQEQSFVNTVIALYSERNPNMATAIPADQKPQQQKLDATHFECTLALQRTVEFQKRGQARTFNRKLLGVLDYLVKNAQGVYFDSFPAAIQQFLQRGNDPGSGFNPPIPLIMS